VRTALEDETNEVLLSLVSVWEVAIKYALGRLTLPAPPDPFVPDRLARDGIAVLNLDLQDALDVGPLPRHHGDPFDRLLIVQAIRRRIPIATGDAAFARYPDLDILWD
jgi:PIN domain nuclease of toxin-antitoxin system